MFKHFGFFSLAKYEPISLGDRNTWTEMLSLTSSCWRKGTFFGHGLFHYLSFVSLSSPDETVATYSSYKNLFCVETEIESQTSSWSTMALSTTDVSCQCPTTLDTKNKSFKWGKDTTKKRTCFPKCPSRAVISSDALAAQTSEICGLQKNTRPLPLEPLNFGL